MVQKSTPYALFLLAIDIVFLSLALWFTLLVRYLAIPDSFLYLAHWYPFAYIFAIWIIVYFIYDLYRVHISFFQKKLLVTLFNVHIINSVIAVIFFYLIPYFGITPKTNMFIFLFISFVFMAIWRIYLAPIVFKNRSESIVFACRGQEVDQLSEHFKNNTRQQITVCESLHNNDIKTIKERFPQASLIAINTYSQQADILSGLYQLIFSGLKFISVEGIYEDLFGRVPLTLISERWFLQHVSVHSKPLYDFLKRFIDLVVAILLGIISLVFYPIVFILIKIEDGGPIFFKQERVGIRGKVFSIYKFRSMSSGQVTRVGRFLRALRIDELPQLVSVIRGDLSLVGPRPERPDYVEKYRDDIAYYDIRHLITPGLSGWAQLYHENHPHFDLEVEATREKLSYDLYYIKNRSLILDLIIIIKTIRVLLSRSGR